MSSVPSKKNATSHTYLSSCKTHFLHESVDPTPIMIRFTVAYSIHSNFVLVHFGKLPDYTRGE